MGERERARYLSHCPACGTTILYCDGQPTPDILYKSEVDLLGVERYRAVGCGRCNGKRAPAAPPPKRPASPAPDPRPLREQLAAEASAVGSFVGDVLDVADAVRRAFRKWSPRR